MIFNLRSSIGGKRGIITADSFSFGGGYLFSADEEGNFELALLESGTLQWNTLPGEVDICLVGAGQSGEAAFFSGAQTLDYNDSFINSGKGGDSGRVLTVSNVAIDGDCTIVIGTSGSDSSLACNGVTYTSANGPAPKEGGRGAEMRQATNSAGTVNKGGAEGVWPFETDTDEQMISELRGHRVAASGGGGHANNNYSHWDIVHQYSIPFPVWTDEHGGVNAGGETDAGDGATRDHHNGYAATGYGNGGGGGYGDGLNHVLGDPGAGSSGIIYIRNHREANA